MKYQATYQICKTTISYQYPSWRRKTCSKECKKILIKSHKGEDHGNWKLKGKIECPTCKTMFYPHRGTKKHCSKICYTTAQIGKKQSLETRIKRGKAHLGEKSHFWKGGITPINKKARETFEQKEWGKNIKIRDDFTCQLCNKRGVELHSNHIKKFSDFPNLRLESTNGITVCKECHIRVVTGYEEIWEDYFYYNLKVRGFL